MQKLTGRVWAALVLCVWCSTLVAANNFYVSPNGDDSATGTATAPFRTISHAVSIAESQDSILLLSGTFTEKTTINVTEKSLSFATASGQQDVVIASTADGLSMFWIAANSSVSMKDLTFNGAGGWNSCITLESSSLSLANLMFRDCTSAFGGAIFLDDFSVLSATDCTFQRNTAQEGGALYNKGGTLSLINSQFKSNIAFFSASDYAKAQGGAIFTSGTATMSACSFTNNTASTSSKQYSISTGAAIYNDGLATLSDCVFANNTAISDYNAVSKGGAIFSSDTDSLALVRCTFTNNKVVANALWVSMASGGAVYAYGPLALDHCVFTNNAVKATATKTNKDVRSYGGAVSCSGETTADSCTFTGNRVSHKPSKRDYHYSYGGAIYNDDFPLTLTSCTLSHNRAAFGGAVYTGSSEATIENCVLTSNKATKKCGAIYSTVGTGTSCVFECNLAKEQFDDNLDYFTCSNCTFNVCPPQPSNVTDLDILAVFIIVLIVLVVCVGSGVLIWWCYTRRGQLLQQSEPYPVLDFEGEE